MTKLKTHLEIGVGTMPGERIAACSPIHASPDYYQHTRELGKVTCKRCLKSGFYRRRKVGK